MGPTKDQYGDTVEKVTGELAATGAALPIWVFVAVAVVFILTGIGMWWVSR